MKSFKDKANLIWEVANLLRGDYKQSDYGKVILPMTVLRHLDCVLAPTKQKVLDSLPKVKNLSENAKDLTLNKVAGFNFHNHSQFDFASLVADPNNIAANLRNHINGYSASAREIIEYFNFDDQIERMDDPKADILFQTVEQPQKDRIGNIVKSNGESKADSKLRDYENIPFLQKDKNGKLIPQSIEEYFAREVKPHFSDA